MLPVVIFRKLFLQPEALGACCESLMMLRRFNEEKGAGTGEFGRKLPEQYVIGRLRYFRPLV